MVSPICSSSFTGRYRPVVRMHHQRRIGRVPTLFIPDYLRCLTVIGAILGHHNKSCKDCAVVTNPRPRGTLDPWTPGPPDSASRQPGPDRGREEALKQKQKRREAQKRRSAGGAR